MELIMTSAFWSTVAVIVVINLVLSGDNAVVIAMAARRLPPARRKLAVVWGAVGAVLVRIVLTLTVVWVLGVPGLMGVGGVLLAWIAYRLISGDDGGAATLNPASTFWSAIRTIVIADATMGLDNVLGVAGAAHGNMPMIVFGLVLSVPIVVWGSTLIMQWLERFPSLLYAGGGILAYTAASMIREEPLVHALLARLPGADWALAAALVSGVIGLGWWQNHRPAPRSRLVRSE